MRIFYSLTAVMLVLNCSGPGVFSGSMKSTGNGADGTGLSPEAKDAIAGENEVKNEPPTVITNPNDIKNLGLDLNSPGVKKYAIQWTANPIDPADAIIADDASHKTITLSGGMVSGSQIGTQVTRQKYSTSKDQTGQTGKPHTMPFKSQAAGILDVLLVIDSSGSMNDEQAALAGNLPSLLKHIEKSNWRVAVVNTDPKCDFRSPISKTTANYEAEYKKNVKVGTYGGTELAVYNAIRAMKGECGNTPWLRDSSTVAVIVLTDEPHQCQVPSVCSTANKLQTYLHSIRKPEDVKIFGLVAGTAWKREAMFDHVGDVKDKSQYDTVFQQISSSVKNSLKSSYDLRYTPDSITSVKVAGKTLSSSDYTLKGKVITFNAGILPKDKDVEVEVKYSYGSKPYIYDLTLDHMPLAGAEHIIVTVDKPGTGTDTTLQYGTHFTLNGRQLSFNGCSTTACVDFPAGSSVQVQYKENIALKNKFVITGSKSHHIMMSSLRVEVNSVAATGYKVKDEPNGDKAIKFNSPPAEGAKITVYYKYLSKLSYKFNLNTRNTTDALTCYDAHNPSTAITCSYNSGKVVFGRDAAATDKVVVFEKLAEGEFSLDHVLDGDYVGSSIKVACVLGDGTARDLLYSVSASVLSLDEGDYNACKQSAIDGSTSYSVSIAYNIRRDDQDNFHIDRAFFTKHAGKYKFIYVVVEIDSDGDGVFSTVNLKDFNFEFDYYNSAQDAKVAFLKTLPDDTEVRATVYLLPY